MNIYDWLKYGRDHGFCGPAVCFTHDGLPSSEAEDIAYEEGDEPCLHMVRLYEDDEHKLEVEANHSPSVWR